jgi:hypothetical protein
MGEDKRRMKRLDTKLEVKYGTSPALYPITP